MSEKTSLADYSAEWPYNMLNALDVGFWNRLKDPLDMIDDQGNFEAAMAISHLIPREKKVLRLRYIGEMTQEQVGEMLGIKRERVRQIEAKALAKIRRNDAAMYVIVNGVKAYVEYRIREGIEAGLEIKRKELEAQYAMQQEEADNAEKEKWNEKISRLVKARATTVEELGLTIRPFNCLWRAGCETVGDILDKYPTYDDAIGIRNLGKKSLDEISVKLRYLGLDWPKASIK